MDRVCKHLLRSLLPVLPPGPPQSAGGAGTAAAREINPADALALVLDSATLLSPHMLRKDPRTAGLLSLVTTVAAAIDRAAQLQAPATAPEQDVEAFLECDAYNFAADATFQAGLGAVLPKIQQRDMLAGKLWNEALAIAEAQAFYFSKCVKPVDVAGYIQWKQAESVQPPPSRHPAVATGGPDSTVHTASDPAVETIRVGDVGDDVKLSFEEVMALVAAGKEVPGCRKVDVVVQEEEEPSESVLQRPRKPWETSGSATLGP
jgi:hypothetical protein